MSDNLIISEHIGLNTPTVVYHKGERLETIGLNIETLVKTWREKWFNLQDEWIVLACSEREFNAIQQRPLHGTKSVKGLFYEQKVICINRKRVQEILRRVGNE